MLKSRLISFIIRLFHLNFPGSTVPFLLFISRWIPANRLQAIAIVLMKVAGPDLSAEWISRLFTDSKTRSKIKSEFVVNKKSTQETEVTPIDPAVKKIILHQTISVLESNGIRPFLCFGSLLGLIRENGFMAHDSDLDIGILYDESSCETVKQVLEKNGFEIYIYESDPWPCRIIAYNNKLSLNFRIDVVFFKAEEDKLLTYSRIHDHVLIRKRSGFKLERTTFLDIPVWIPSHPEYFLNENYGNWSIKSDFHHYIFTSPLTDLNDPMVRYFLAKTILKLSLIGSPDLSQYLEFAEKHYPGDSIWAPMNKILE